MRGFLVLFALAGCQGRGTADVGIPALSVALESPTYGSFAGDAPIYVNGSVSHPAARVYVEGLQVPVASDGRFEAWVPIEGAYRNLDVEAVLVQQYERVRIPVFSGQDPLDTWPGGIPLRFTNGGLAKLGEGLGAQIDAAEWADGLLGALPSVDSDGFTLTPVGVSHEPTIVALEGAPQGLALAVVIEDLVFDLDLRVGDFAAPVTVGFQEIQLGATAVPGIDDAGMITLSLTDTNVTLSDAIVELDGEDNFLLELLADGLGWVLGSVGELLGDLILDGVLGDLPLGGPIAFDTDLIGTGLSIRLAEIFGDPDGLALGLGVGIDSEVEAGPLSVPYPGDVPGADLAVGLHEGLFQFILSSDLLDLLEQDIQLGGVFGNVLGVVVLNLPGGNQAPEVDGWCVSVNPGEARVARLQAGIEPLAIIHLPDLRMNIGYTQGSSTCIPWLDASLAVDLGLGVEEGTKLGLSVEVPDGAVLAYGAAGQEEQEVVAGLAGLLDTVIGLAGGQFELDLADFLGGGDLGLGFGTTELQIVSSTPVLDPETSVPVEGMYTLSMQLFE